MAFEIMYSPEAVDHLTYLSTVEQTIVVREVQTQLAHQPTLPTRKRKLLRQNPVAPWVLRLGDLRVFYDVSEILPPKVLIKAIGKKVHKELWIGGERIEL